MLIPIRCFTCGTVIGSKWVRFRKLRDEDNHPDPAGAVGVKRYCCRTALICNVDMVDILESGGQVGHVAPGKTD